MKERGFSVLPSVRPSVRRVHDTNLNAGEMQREKWEFRPIVQLGIGKKKRETGGRERRNGLPSVDPLSLNPNANLIVMIQCAVYCRTVREREGFCGSMLVFHVFSQGIIYYFPALEMVCANVCVSG